MQLVINICIESTLSKPPGPSMMDMKEKKKEEAAVVGLELAM